MTAAATVLETYELLENILASLDPQAVPVADQVCKTWHTLVRRSRRIRMARCIQPKYFYGKIIPEKHGPALYGPLYEYSQRFRVNKLVVGRWVPDDPTKWIRIPRELLNNPAVPSEQYISDPPITTMNVHVREGYRQSHIPLLYHGGVKCTLRKEQGIMIGDLVEVAVALRASERRYAGVGISAYVGPDVIANGVFRVGSEHDEAGHQELTRF